MTRLTAPQLLLRNLEQKISSNHSKIYMSREDVYNHLKRMTGQDFGYDVAAWKQWFKENRKKKTM